MSADRIFEIAVYFHHTDIRIWMFLPIIPDRTELKVAVRSLHDRGLVVFSENTDSFSVIPSARVRCFQDLWLKGRDEQSLKETIRFFQTAKPSYFLHFIHVYDHAKRYPNLLGDLGILPGRMLEGMINAKRYTSAVAWGKEWTEGLQKALYYNHWTVLHLRSRHGLAFLEKGESKKAMDMLVDVYRRTCIFGYGDDQIRDVMTVMCEVFIRADKSDDNLRLVVFNGKKVSDSKDESHIDKWVRYANAVSSFGLTRVATSILQEVINFRRRVFGPRDDKISDIMLAKARILAKTARFSEALKVLRKVYTIRVNKFGALDPGTMKVKIKRGIVLMKQLKLDEALKLFEQVVERTKSSAHPEWRKLNFRAKSKIVLAYQLQRKFAEAREHWAGIPEHLLTTYGRFHRKYFSFRLIMGNVFMELNKPHETLKIFKELLENFENSYDHEEGLQTLRAQIYAIESSVFSAGLGTLHAHAKSGDSKAVANLIDSGENVDGRDWRDLTPLHYASAFGQTEVARVLLQKGACYAPVSKNGSTPLDFARDPEMLQLANTAVDFFNAVDRDDMDLIAELSSKEPCLWGANSPGGQTPLIRAARCGLVDRVKKFLDLGVDPNAQGTYHRYGLDYTATPLKVAARWGHLDVVKLLVKKGALKAPQNRDVLHAAAESRSLEMVKYLLAQGAVYCSRDTLDRQMPRQKDSTPAIKSLLRLVEGLFLDTRKGKVKKVVARLEEMEPGEVAAVSGARNDELRTLVQVAGRQGNKELVRRLVKRFKTK